MLLNSGYKYAVTPSGEEHGEWKYFFPAHSFEYNMPSGDWCVVLGREVGEQLLNRSPSMEKESVFPVPWIMHYYNVYVSDA